MNIQLSGIQKSYGEKVVLRDLSLTFPEGKTTLLMGESGIGKTTILHLLLGTLQPDGGEILGLPHSVSVAFQKDALCPQLSVEDNIRLALPYVQKEEIASALSAVGLVGEGKTKANALSGGMGRRASVVRAMLSNAPLVLLDEPFRGLDEDSKAKTAAFIVEKSQGRTVIVVTHDKEDKDLLEADLVISL